jgi:hypothetical protein
MACNYRVQDQESAYFLVLTVHQWEDVFSRKAYAYIIIESLKYCQKSKGLEIYG